jgi:hypothetical protein
MKYRIMGALAAGLFCGIFPIVLYTRLETTYSVAIGAVSGFLFGWFLDSGMRR